MSLVLGLDAGNTKTVALLARLDGAIVGSGRGGCGDIYGAGSPEAALVQIETAVEAAFACAGLKPDLGSLAAACGSMAGADWPEDFALLRAELEARGLRRNLSIFNDAFGALRAGSPDGFGVAVACGTGTATGARAPDGRLWHTSYWQGPQGALQLAQLVLEAVYRAELGLDPPTSMTNRVLDYFKLSSVEEVLHHLTGRGPRPSPDSPTGHNGHNGRAVGYFKLSGVEQVLHHLARRRPRPSARRPGLELGPLARVLLDEAHAGDPSALAIAQRHGAALGDYALVAARHVGLAEGAAPFTLVLAGGVLRHPTNVLKAALVERVRASAPGVQPVMTRFEPVVGAVLLALEAAGITPGEPVLARLAATLPPAALFAT